MAYPDAETMEDKDIMNTLCVIADKWEQLGVQFGFTENELRQIKMAHPHSQCKDWMFTMISQKKARSIGFGWKDIIKALHSIGCTNIAGKISENIVCSQNSKVEDVVILRLMDKSESKLQRKFASLVYFAVDEIERKSEVKFMNFRTYVITTFVLGDCVLEANCYRQVFDYMGQEKKWDYMNFSPLLELLEEFIDDETRERRYEYLDAFNAFSVTKKITETMSKRDLTKMPQEYEQLEYHHNYREMCIKLHPHKVTERSLTFVNELWEAMSRHFSIPSVRTVLQSMPSLDAEADCISATLSSHTHRGLKKMMERDPQFMKRFMQQNNIEEIVFGDGDVYPMVGFMFHVSLVLKSNVSTMSTFVG
jgi:hypothetical protein